MSGGPLAANGLDVSITNGTLAVTDSTNTQLLETEIVQTVAGMSQISWSFDWTSPSTYGSVTMHVAGFSGDGDGRKDQDDLWNTASLTIVVSVLGDCDGDRDVDYDDFIVLAGAYGSSSGDPAFVQATDFDADGDVDYDDFIILAGNYGKSV